MTAKEYLKQYRKIVYEIENLEREIEELEERITSVRSTIGDGMPHGTSTTSNLDRLIPALVDMKRRKEALKVTSEWRRVQIEAAIDRIGDPIYCRLLRDKYIRLMSWLDITADLDLRSVDYTRGKLHRKALEAAEATFAEMES